MLKNKNTKTIKQNGGKFVAQGSYGCIFDPIIKCDNVDFKKKKYPQTVGKIFLSTKLEDFLYEYNMMRKIEKIDPHHNFSVKFYGKCKVSEKSFYKNDQKDKCKNLFFDTSHQQLIYANKGIDLNVIPDNIDIDTIFNCFKTIINATKILNYDNNIIHLDIKPSNILYCKKEKKLYLIDYGLTVEKKNFLSKCSYWLFAKAYRYYPPEFQLYYYFANSGLQFSFMHFTEIYETKIDYHKIGDIFEKYGVNNYKQQLKDIYILFRSAYKKNKLEGIKKLFHKSFNKIDIYGIGITMLELIDRFHNINEEKKKNIIIFISKITNFNPFERLSGLKALEEYNKII